MPVSVPAGVANLFVSAIFLASGIARAQEAREQNATERFGDWELTCPTAAAGASSCRLTQQLAVKDNGKTVFALTILPGDKKNALVGVASIPLGGYIAPGIELRIDNGRAYKLLVETCNSGGCHAGFPISDRLRKELAAGKTASFRVWTAKAKPADISLSLAGTTKALTALTERSAGR